MKTRFPETNIKIVTFVIEFLYIKPGNLSGSNEQYALCYKIILSSLILNLTPPEATIF